MADGYPMKDAENILIRPADGGVMIAVKVVPGSSRDKVAGALGDCLKITTSAAPEKGRANAAVAKILHDLRVRNSTSAI